MQRRRCIVEVTLGSLACGTLAFPVAASAKARCGDLPSRDIYMIAGPSCSVAKAVAVAHERQLVPPGAGGKHYVRAVGRRWHLIWRFRNVSGRSYSQIEYYRATSRHQVVTFQTHGSN